MIKNIPGFQHIFILLFFCTAVNAQLTTFAYKANKLTGTFGVYHYKPIELSATTSAEVCDLFIEELDGKGMVLKQGDISLISKNKNELFNQLNKGSNDFVINAAAVYSKALKSADSLLSLLYTKPLNFNENDTAYFLPITTKTFYSPNLKYHAKRMERYIKSKSYDRVCNAEDFEKLGEKEFNERANEYSKNIIDNLRKNIHGLITQVDKTTETSLLNAIALRYDPHSNYFNEEQNSEFTKQLSSSVESFGLFFDADDDGNVVIGFIEPGGAAWQSNLVNEGDVLVSLKMGSTLLTPEGNTFENLQEKLDNTTEKRISLTLKKQNGQQKTVKLIKQKIASAENSVKGFVLKQGNEKIGYISLPSFYTDMRDHNMPGCANDVAKEIVKLEHDTIKGLIIDLRNNGGGSMQEAMNLAGIFVDEGPLFILKEKDKKPFIVKDINR
ncbi:MAG: S41 family peptidase, partial [Bacteroidia bacterium]